jgi:carbon storage regulator CsrA
MLVLSRKLKEKIVFPTVGASVQILDIKRGLVRLGITAPPDVTILREEVPDRAAEWGRPQPQARPPDRAAVQAKDDDLARRLGDRLKTAGMGLGLLRLQLEAGNTDEARATLAALHEDFQRLLDGVEKKAEVPPAPPADRPGPRAGKRRKALLVEDDRNERELLAGFLRLSGLEVDTAGDGSDALDYLHTHARPDVVLLDMVMPRMDGPTVVKQLRRDSAYAGLKIFGVSGHLPDEFDLERGPSGIDRWFQKPLDPSALLHDLQEELHGSPCGV